MEKQIDYTKRFEQVHALSDALQEILDSYGIMEVNKSDYIKQKEVDSYWFWEKTEQLAFIKIFCEWETCNNVYNDLINKKNLEERIGFKTRIRHVNPEVILIYIDPIETKMSLKR